LKARGRRPPLTNRQRRLAVRYLPLATALARRKEKTCGAEREELESIAYLALVEAAGAFNRSCKVSFATYARCRIRWALRQVKGDGMAQPSGAEGAREISVRNFGEHTEGQGQIWGMHPDGPIGTEIEASETIEEWLSRLPGVLAATCRLIYQEGRSQEEAAELLGCSRSYLSRLHRQAIFWLTRRHEENSAWSEAQRP
jgi:DNA-directed RNA polymerase specialized sigma subunit